MSLPRHHQKSSPQVARLALILISILFLSSCGDDEKATAEIVGPSGGPRVDESLLAFDVIDGVPVGITSIFLQEDIVHLWVRWEGLEPPHQAESVWYNPNGGEVASALVEIVEGPSDQVTDFSLELTLSSMIGRWEVALYLDGELQRSHAFDVFEAP